jgi:antagonist of KipI
MLTTIQDAGRWGHQANGIPVAGPMDEYSHALASRLVGNRPSAAALEVTLIGPELEANADLVCAVAGAEFTLSIDGVPLPGHRPFTLRRGARLRFGERTAGARATFAVQGGIAVDPVFGSRATSVISQMGPFGGRALKAGDVLPIGSEPAASDPSVQNAGHVVPLPLPEGGATLRVIVGPQEQMFTRSAFRTLFGSPYLITTNSNRMGYRLEGPKLAHRDRSDILSDATPFGTIQVPASGQPILLMADRQTTGGYPKIATVIGADLPLAGQLAPGDWIEFRPCTREQAVEARRTAARLLAGLERGPWERSR